MLCVVRQLRLPRRNVPRRALLPERADAVDAASAASTAAAAAPAASATAAAAPSASATAAAATAAAVTPFLEYRSRARRGACSCGL